VKLCTLTKTVTVEKMARYSGAGNIHTDEAEARRIGLGGLIVQGGQLAGYLNEMMCTSLGRGFIEGGELSVTFIKSARAGDTLTTGGEEKSRSVVDGKTRIEYDVWLENQNGEKLTVGTASGFADARR
jgi:acyl dehydratase